MGAPVGRIRDDIARNPFEDADLESGAGPAGNEATADAYGRTAPAVEEFQGVKAISPAVLPTEQPASGYSEDETQQDAAAAAIDPMILLNYLRELLGEARTARESGPEARDDQWRRNWEAYWTRYDHSGVEDWQAQEDLPDVANYVERFVAALRRALTAAGREWFTFIDPLDEDGVLEGTVKKIVELGLSRCGRNSTGQPIGFPSVFSAAMKDGALMMPALAVLWRDGRLAIDVVDARELYYDPTGRGLYRFREREIDKHELLTLSDLKDARGEPLYDREAIDRCAASGGKAETQTEDKERSTGVGQQTTTRFRKTFTIQEFYGTILNDEGESVAKNQLIVMANESEIIRGPERCPFWHGQDWVVAAPLISVPHSVYGKSYVEGFANLVQTFIDMTNLILDGIQTTSIPAYQGWPDAMEDPTSLAQGVSPGKVFLGNEDAKVGEPFVSRIETGQINPQAFQVWEALRGLVREASSQNELRLGQLTNRSGVTATEVDSANAGTEALLEHIAEDVEEQLLSPVLNLVWPTMLQHLDPETDKKLKLELGPEISEMIVQRRNEFRDRTVQLRASGVSGLLKRSRERRALMEMMQVIGQSETLSQVFARKLSFESLLMQILRTGGIDPATLALSDEERAQQLQAAQASQRSAASPPAAGQGDAVTQGLLKMVKGGPGGGPMGGGGAA
jgi:hypothetical protein